MHLIYIIFLSFLKKSKIKVQYVFVQYIILLLGYIIFPYIRNATHLLTWSLTILCAFTGFTHGPLTQTPSEHLLEFVTTFDWLD